MTKAKALERFLLVLVLIPLAITGVAGIRDAVRTAAHTGTAVQAGSAGAKLCFGLFACIGAWAVVTRRRWALQVLVVWAVSLAVATVLEPPAWSGTPWKDAVGAGSFVKVALSGLVVWGGAAYARRKAFS
jgi:hypothetical protein